ncbi:MAG: tetratricopeptide repeat protein [Proteobacteria bacterium]|nr:tetratricopeptide repeat protein [Pseudomonadota bacterium]MDA1059701.1 tetratricopeptide repeat protein [Pseudomonadota bacterium]
MIKRLGLVAALFLWVGAASAQTLATFDDGRVAAEAGQYDQARDIWARLAAVGDADSQNALGYIYHKGLGVLRDYQRAFDFYTAAAEQGNANAANSLGIMYTQGQGVPRDYIRAYSWYSLAAIQGEDASVANRGIIGRALSYQDLQAANQMSLEAISRIAKRLTPEQITLARSRAEKFLSTRDGAATTNATIATVPRTRLEGAPKGLVDVPDTGSAAVAAAAAEKELEEQAGPKLPSLTPLNN